MKDWLTHRVRTSPAQTALVDAETDEEWTYDALDDEVTALAGRLAALGVRAGDHVGTLVGTRPVAVELVHAAMRLGAALVPLNRRLTADELAGEIETADLTVLVCDAETEAVADDAAGSVPLVTVDDPGRESVERLGDATPEAVEPYEWDRSDTLALVFTSGTTGSAKAVTLTMENVLSSAVASAFRLGVTPQDRWLVALSLYHMGGLAPLYRSVLYGTTIVLREEFDPGATADDIGAHDVTGVSLVPTMLQRMLDSRGTLSGSLRFVLLGGAPASENLVRRCRDYSVPVHPTYGMTETASQISTALPEEAFEHAGTVGRPLLWTDLTVVDDDDGEPVDVGESGELVVSGPTVTPGYYDDDETTAAAFGPYGLHTGDVGYVDDGGRVYVRNRLDDRILSGGESVDPGEVVDVLRDHPGVADAAVVGLPDETWGERVAALVVASNSELSDDELEAHCRERLAGFKLPRRFAFADELPRTASGTVEREAVRERLRADEGDEGNGGPNGNTGTEAGDDPDDVDDPDGHGDSGDPTGSTVPEVVDAEGGEAAEAEEDAEAGESAEGADETGDIGDVGAVDVVGGAEGVGNAGDEDTGADAETRGAPPADASRPDGSAGDDTFAGENPLIEDAEVSDDADRSDVGEEGDADRDDQEDGADGVGEEDDAVGDNRDDDADRDDGENADGDGAADGSDTDRR